MRQPRFLAIVSVILLAGLCAALAWREHGPRSHEPNLIVYVAPTCRLPMEQIAAEYERESAQHVELRIGPSEDILTKVRMPNPVEPADLFIPADESYIRQARELGHVEKSFPLARIRAVVLLAKDNPRGIVGWGDLTKPGMKLGVPNTGAAIGKLAREHLSTRGFWEGIEPRVVDCGSVTEAANATRVGSVDAAIVWDVVALAPAFRQQTFITVPQLDEVVGRIEVAVLRQSRQPEAARRFASFLRDPQHGLAHFRAAGFPLHDPASPGLEPQP